MVSAPWATPVISAPQVAAGRRHAAHMTALPEWVALAMRQNLVRLVTHREVRAARALRRAAHRLRPTTASTPRTVALVHGFTPCVDRAQLGSGKQTWGCR